MYGVFVTLGVRVDAGFAGGQVGDYPAHRLPAVTYTQESNHVIPT